MSGVRCLHQLRHRFKEAAVHSGSHSGQNCGSETNRFSTAHAMKTTPGHGSAQLKATRGRAKSHEGIRMADTRNRKPPGDQSRHSVPGQMVSLAATAQHRPPQATYSLAEGKQGRAIHGYAVVAGVAQYDRAQVCPLFRSGRVQALPQFRLQFPQLGLPPLPHRLPKHREPALPRLRTAMREAEKVKGPWFTKSQYITGGNTMTYKNKFVTLFASLIAMLGVLSVAPKAEAACTAATI